MRRSLRMMGDETRSAPAWQDPAEKPDGAAAVNRIYATFIPPCRVGMLDSALSERPSR